MPSTRLESMVLPRMTARFVPPVQIPKLQLAAVFPANVFPWHQHSTSLCGLSDVSFPSTRLSSEHASFQARMKIPSPPKVRSLRRILFLSEPDSKMIPAESYVVT